MFSRSDVINTLCEEKTYCNDLDCDAAANDITDSNLECFLRNTPQGNPLILNITEVTTTELLNTRFRCDVDVNIEQGDPWCEYGTEQLIDFVDNYDSSSLDVCVSSPDVCDFGQQGVASDYGCSDIFASPDDVTWSQYDASCVKTVSATVGVYDQACCLAYTINNFDVYDDALQDGNVQNGIRIY